MAKINVNDRAALERVYSQATFAGDAAQNDLPTAILRGVRIGTAPDAGGWFEIEPAARHSGEPETPYFVTAIRRVEELVESGGAPQQSARPTPRNGYAQFLDDVIAAAKRFGFRQEESPGRGEKRLSGFHGG